MGNILIDADSLYVIIDRIISGQKKEEPENRLLFPARCALLFLVLALLERFFELGDLGRAENDDDDDQDDDQFLYAELHDLPPP
jgi:hypothetical protein